MRKTSILDNATYLNDKVNEWLVHESEGMRVKGFYLKAGQELPVQSYEVSGETMLVVLGGEGQLLGRHGVLDSLGRGDVVIVDLQVPHGLRAKKDMSVLASYTSLHKPLE